MLRHPLPLAMSCLVIALCGCTDLSFLDDAITPEGQAADAPELAPHAELGIPSGGEIDTEDPTEEILARGAALQSRANSLR